MPRCFLPSFLSVCWLGLAFAAASAEENAAGSAQEEFFEKTVRPVLASHCIECHGPQKQKGGLRLDSREAILKGGDSGPAIVPGKPSQSLIITAVHYDKEPQMPPKGKLRGEQVAALTRWVSLNAPWPKTENQVRTAIQGSTFKISDKDRAFWCFQPVSNPLLPPVRDDAWPQTSIDYFVLAKLEAAGLQSAAPADKRTLLRRVTFDLTGLPPTVAELDAFLNDHSPEAFAHVVDRLLNSPHYGERWTRHWLDVARYGEDQAHSFQPRLYPHGYRYRDWLIRAFNDDLPCDRFLKEQIAADLLDEPNPMERAPALGFFSLGPVYYGDRLKLDQYDDRIDTLMRGVLGLTVACARCHDHKFDPISTQDYYSLVGVIASTDYNEIALGTKEEIEAHKKEMQAKKNRNIPPKYPVIHSLKDAATPVTMRVQIRGNPENQGEEAPRRFLSILGGKPLQKGSGRLELAEAIASKDNPLTARVLVNRIWQHHFGKGLVRTPSNFGNLGERPTHPELLDHLARRFMDEGWSLKKLHREILLSATYQQSGELNVRNYEVDPDNKFLWRMNRQRLEVESWRDAMLAVSDKLDRTVGGPSSDLASPDNRRRTLYGRVSRHDLNSLLRLFDFPDPNITAGERTVTTVPLQQLFVLNSEFMVGNAKALAARLTAGAGPDNAACIRKAFPLLYSRPATEQELHLGLEFLSQGNTGEKLSRWEQYAQVLLSANEFLYVD
jgi:mono/diheme cytochrome c family protein